MKNLILFLFISFVLYSSAQIPEGFNYQAVLRNSLGEVISNSNVAVRISILQNSETGTTVYSEVHTKNTNEFGLVNLVVGNGDPIMGEFSSISWGNTNFYIKVELDKDGRDQFINMGTMQLLSVPFAFHAKTVEMDNVDDADSDPENEIQYLDFRENTIYLTNGGSIQIPEGFDGYFSSLKNIPENLDIDATDDFSGDYNNLLNLPDIITDPDIRIGKNAGSGSINTYTNVAIGNEVLNKASMGGNLGVGYHSLKNNNAGEQNIALGLYSLLTNTEGNKNVGVGTHTLFYNETGCNNSALGYSALRYNTTGHSNVAIGTDALRSNTDKSNLVAIGDSSLYNNGIGASLYYHSIDNVAIGEKSLYSNTIGNANSAVGARTLNKNISGERNNAFGNAALYSNETGSNNNAFGYNSLVANISGTGNCAIGSYSLTKNTEGTGNCAFGSSALRENLTGDDNVAIGGGSMSGNKNGNENTAIGTDSFRNGSGNGNTAVGYSALISRAGDNNTAVGNGAGPDENDVDRSNLYNTGAFGYNAKVRTSNTITIGNSDIIQIGGYAKWTDLSDERFKINVKQNVPGIDFIMKLEPVTYKWDLDKLDKFLGTKEDYIDSQDMQDARNKKESKIYTGFIAQDVEKAAIECDYEFSAIVKPENERSHYNLAYSEFVVPLVKAVQEQQKIIETMQREINLLKQQLAKD